MDIVANSPRISTRRDEEHPDLALMHCARYGGNWKAWVAFVTLYIGILALLVTYNQLKQTDPFQTHLGLIIMSIGAFFMTLITSGIVLYTNNNLQNLMKDHYYYPVFDVILKILLWFNVILAPLSLVLLLFTPSAYNWTAYVIICVVFVGVIAVSFKSLKKSLATTHATNSGASEMV